MWGRSLLGMEIKKAERLESCARRILILSVHKRAFRGSANVCVVLCVCERQREIESVCEREEGDIPKCSLVITSG